MDLKRQAVLGSKLVKKCSHQTEVDLKPFRAPTEYQRTKAFPSNRSGFETAYKQMAVGDDGRSHQTEVDLKLISNNPSWWTTWVPIKPKWIWNVITQKAERAEKHVPIKPKWIWNYRYTLQLRMSTWFPSNRSGFETTVKFPWKRGHHRSHQTEVDLKRFSGVSDARAARVPIKPKWIWNLFGKSAKYFLDSFPSNRSGFETSYRVRHNSPVAKFPSNRSGFETVIIFG